MATRTNKTAKKDLLAIKGVAPNEEKIVEALEAGGVEIPEDATIGDKVQLLRKLLKTELDATPEDEHVRCVKCGEVSLDEMECCPYCGDAGSDDDDNETAEIVEAEEVDEEPAPAKKAPKAELAKSEPKELSFTKSEADLDKAVIEIKRLQSDLMANSWDLAIVLTRVQKEELWKARGYKSFAEFLAKETTITRSYCYALIGMSSKYDRETFREVGPAKLLIAARVPEEERDQVIADAKAGKSVRELKEKAKITKSAIPASAKSERGRPKKSEQEITLLAKVNGKPTLLQWRAKESHRPVSEWKDESFAQFDLSDSVRMFVALKIDKKTGANVGVQVAFAKIEAQ